MINKQVTELAAALDGIKDGSTVLLGGFGAVGQPDELIDALLEQGATFEEVADILGNSPAVVRKHYGKWSKGRQANIDRLMFAHFQTAATLPVTKMSHDKTEAVN